jgi:type VI secretion system VasD/TssJ family lipoprotein
MPSQPSGLTNNSARRFVQAVGCFALVALLSACATANNLLGGNTRKTAVAEIAWEFAPNAVLIEVEADNRLNEHAGEAHTLLLGVYQMEDSAVFYKLIADMNLVSKALESGKGGDGFADFSRHVVQPGQRAILSLDRAQKAKFIGITAGYYRMEAAKSARLFQIPLTVVSEGLVTTTYKAAPAVLALRVNLGPGELLNAQRLNHDPTDKRLQEAVPLDGGGKELKLGAQDIQRALTINNAIKKVGK